LAVAAALALIGSIYLPWYTATSDEDFCGFLVAPYGGDGQSDACLFTHANSVDLWTFWSPSMLLVGAALAAAIAVSVAQAGSRAADARLWRRGALVAILAALVATVIATDRLITPPGPSGLFSVTYGAWFGFGAALAMLSGAVLGAFSRD
jgi:hypothetical protein